MQTRTMPKKGPPRFARRCLDKSVGYRVRKHREVLGISRNDLAGDAAIAPHTLARIERGDQLPTEETLRRIADALGMPLGLLAPDWAVDELERITTGAEHLGVGLRQLRIERSITLAEAADTAGVSVSTLSRFERGLHGEGELAKLYKAEGRMTERLTLVSESLAKLFGYRSAADLTDACEIIELD